MRSSEYIYYTVNGVKTHNTLYAWELAKGDKDKIHFYWADNEHNKHDWTTEPKENFDELVDQRVKELRDRYNYLCLWYSGGYDSQTILDSFVRTGTRLDEILIFGRPWIKPVQGVNIEQEDPKNYSVFVKNNFQPWLKITIINFDPNTATKFYRKHKLDWIYHDVGHYPWFSKTSRQTVDRFQDDFQRLTEITGRRDIEGSDKPLVDLRDGKWYVQINDRSLNWHMDTDRELFYISPEATKIYIKQAWLAIKWFESRPECSHKFVHEVQSQKYDDATYQSWNLGFGRKKSRSRFEQVGFIKRYFNSSTNTHESYWLKEYASKDNLDSFKIWKKGLQYIGQTYKDIWSPTKGFPTITGKQIYIKDYESL